MHKGHSVFNAASHRQHASQGFTLIEAMVVVALVAILAALAAPSFNTTIANQRVSSAAQEVQTLLLFARAEAVYKRTETTVTPTGQKWEAQVKANSQRLRETVVSDAVTVAPGSTGGVVFDVTGTAKPATGNAPYKLTFSATKASRVQCLSVSATGLVQKKTPTGQSCP